jgi:hypothetical protein
MHVSSIELRILATVQGQRESHNKAQENANATRKIKIFIGFSRERSL